MIYVIGNSHASIFSGQEPMIPFYNEGRGYPILIDSIIPLRFCVTLAYNLYEKNMQEILNYCNININKEKDIILLCFGEVDCRWHLPNQAQLNNTFIADKVQECVDRYFQVFKTLKDNGFRVAAWEAHASCLEGHNEQKDKPIYRDCLYRNYVTRQFNHYLDLICTSNYIPIIGIFNDMIMDNGLTDTRYMMDYCHLGINAIPLIKREIAKIL